MYRIAHRGNLEGKTKWENKPEYIEEALKEGFDVEIDVWYIDGKIMLGHDKPEYLVYFDFFGKTGLWCHAKNYKALEFMLYNNIHCFWHENDIFTLTSKGFIWQYPSEIVYENSIFLMPENFEIEIKNIRGVCSDFIKNYIL